MRTVVRIALVAAAATAVVLLVTTRHASEPDVDRCVRLAVPAYVAPDELVRAGADGQTAVVILNPADGPDIERDEDLVPAVEALRADGVLVLGYVRTDYGEVAIEQVRSEAARYERWYEVDGIFLDEVSSDLEHAPHYVDMAAALRDNAVGTVALNPGVYPDPAYLGAANLLVTFEGTAAEYRALERPSGFPTFAGEWHLVHTADAGDARDAVRLAAQRGITFVYVTDRPQVGDTWNALPPYFDDQVAHAADTCLTLGQNGRMSSSPGTSAIHAMRSPA